MRLARSWSPTPELIISIKLKLAIAVALVVVNLQVLGSESGLRSAEPDWLPTPLGEIFG